MDVEGVETVAAELGLTVVGRLSGGQFGASLVTTVGGARAVLKVLPNDDHWSEERVQYALRSADALRGDGYPISRYLEAGTVDGLVGRRRRRVRECRRARFSGSGPIP